MILFPNCKINLGLRVTGKRNDGYHNIETIFYPIPLKDALELINTNKNAEREFDLEISGMNIPGDLTGNLCFKAYQLIKNDFPEIGPVHLHLLKGIPVGAGLGGGSSDGAHTLLLLDRELKLNLSPEKLNTYALQLGSDCPFFIINKPGVATGRGEEIKEITINLSDYYFVLVDAGVHISTAWAFSRINIFAEHTSSLENIISQSIESWKDHLVNDFEKPVFEEYESLGIIKEDLYAAGAVYASLTGTGSCVYGIFHVSANPQLQKITDHYKVYNLKQNR